MSVSFETSHFFRATPDEIYGAWLDSNEHFEMTGGEADIDARVGGAHSAWDGYISGQFVELEPGRRILMTWRTQEFPKEAADSRVELTFEVEGDGTRLTIRHSDIPDGQPDYEQGWQEHYFEPMSSYFG